MNDWDIDIEDILEKIRINCNNLSIYHKQQYYYYKGLLKYFKIPVIVLSSITSVASVGLASYTSQTNVSIITCLLSLVSAIIGSIELYLGIQASMETSYDVSKQYQILAYDIYKVINLKREHRTIIGKDYLDDKYNEYMKITDNAGLIIGVKIKDALAPVPEEFKMKGSSSISDFLKNKNSPPKIPLEIDTGSNNSSLEMINHFEV